MNARGCLIILSMFFCLSITGCNDDDKKGPRNATEIRYYSDGVCTGYFAYYGFYDGQFGIMTQGGLGFDHHAAEPWYVIGNDHITSTFDVQHNECSYTTESNGVCYVEGYRDRWDAPPQYYPLLSRTSVWHPTQTNMRGVFDYLTFAWDQTHTCNITGTHIMSQEDISTIKALKELPEETASLQNQTTPDPPATGFIKVSSNLAQQSGKMGTEEVTARDYVVPNFYNNYDFMFKHACPMFYSVIIKTAGPVDFENESFNVEVKTNNDSISSQFYCYGSNADRQTHVFRSTPFYVVDDEVFTDPIDEVQVYDHWTPFDGEPNLFDPEQYNKEIKDNWKDYIDPNLISDPNIVPDPNTLYDPMNPAYHTFVSRLAVDNPKFDDILIPERIITIPVIKMNHTEDSLRYNFDEKQISVVLKAVSTSWLENDPVYDLNNDSIVNLNDLTLLQTIDP